MNFTFERIDEIRPDLVRRTRGGWLAVAPSNAPFSIGVTAATEAEAKEKFRYVFSRWLEIIRDTKITTST
jgi:hypothetical protein